MPEPRLQTLEGLDGRAVGAAVDLFLPPMPLHGDDDLLGRTIILARLGDAIAIANKAALQCPHVGAGLAGPHARIARDRRRRHPMTDAGAGEAAPVEPLARIDLARRRHVRVRQHALGRYGMPAEDVAAAVRRHKPGDTITMEFVDRTGVAKTRPVVLAEDPRVEIVPIELTGFPLSAAQRAFRQAWLGAR